MKFQQSFYLVTLALTIGVSGLTVGASAADGKPVINPTGTWKITFSKQTYEPTLKLKLAGAISHGAGGKSEELTIEDGKLKGDQVAFTTHQFARFYQNSVLQPPDTNRMTHSKFQGQISGDTIKGRVERESTMTGTVQTLEWVAKRVRN